MIESRRMKCCVLVEHVGFYFCVI
ncbi:unnamed protein product [Nezara viridula]|uniref:Uncharacterized protein n=1 Tax=Nezara viridula TaxID=85310 RepID=A0A9P0E588_NEZVI|nr:unnamed protein product [Nezara viridula]